jgi:hypothetical protein
MFASTETSFGPRWQKPRCYLHRRRRGLRQVNERDARDTAGRLESLPLAIPLAGSTTVRTKRLLPTLDSYARACQWALGGQRASTSVAWAQTEARRDRQARLRACRSRPQAGGEAGDGRAVSALGVGRAVGSRSSGMHRSAGSDEKPFEPKAACPARRHPRAATRYGNRLCEWLTPSLGACCALASRSSSDGEIA